MMNYKKIIFFYVDTKIGITCTSLTSEKKNQYTIGQIEFLKKNCFKFWGKNCIFYLLWSIFLQSIKNQQKRFVNKWDYGLEINKINWKFQKHFIKFLRLFGIRAFHFLPKFTFYSTFFKLIGDFWNVSRI